MAGGGDKDFNDTIITVRGVPAKGVAMPAPPAKAATQKDNRSGLGDGTGNPNNANTSIKPGIKV